MGKKVEKIIIKPDNATQVEIVAHKKASRQEIARVKKANNTLNSLFEDNHFTLKIYLASKK